MGRKYNVRIDTLLPQKLLIKKLLVLTSFLSITVHDLWCLLQFKFISLTGIAKNILLVCSVFIIQ